jgi:hypothetical protein
MGDYTIHVNVRLDKVGDRNIGTFKDRIWRPLISSQTWVEKGIIMPGYIYDGLGLTFITNTAIIVEGIIADIIDEECVNTKKTPNWGTNLEKATWTKKEKVQLIV